MSTSSSACCVSVYLQSLALTSTACSIDYTALQCIHLHLQGKFLHFPSGLSSIFRIARSWCNLILLISDGSSQLRVHPPNAQGWGLYPVRYTPEPGQDQPRGHSFLSPAAYSLHAMPLPRSPAHPPLQGCIRAPAIQHAPQTKQDDCHSPGVPGGQQAQENYQHFRGTCGPLSRLPPI